MPSTKPDWKTTHPVTAIEPQAKLGWMHAHPRFWWIWLSMGLLRFMVLLPYDWQITLGRHLGRLLYRIGISHRNATTKENLARAYPKLSSIELEQRVKQHFESVGMGLMETAFGWFGNHESIRHRYQIFGMEHYEQAKTNHPNTGVILWWPHFTTMEMSGLIITKLLPITAVYQRNPDPALDEFMRYYREKHAYGSIPTDKIKWMLKALKQGGNIWFSSDQNYIDKGWLDVPLLGTPAPSNPATSRLARISKAPVVPFVTERHFDAQGKVYYELRFLPTLANFAQGDDNADILQLHHIIEHQVSRQPHDFLWLHRRWRRPQEPQ